MSLLQSIQADLVTAMKAKDAEKVSTLRMLTSAFKYKAIEKKDDLSDDDAIAVIQSEIKKRSDAASEFDKGGRPELSAKERQEQTVLTTYLPAQLSDAELLVHVANAIKEAGASSMKDMGSVMKLLTQKIQGRADGKRVSDAVRSRLGV